MAKPSIFKILEQSKISPPPNSAPSTSVIPLTFFDFPWLFFPPSKPLFFYEYHHSTSHFLSATLPRIKLSLSLTLQHFFPFAGNLVLPSESDDKAKIIYTSDDSVSFSVAESNGDFSHLTGNHPRSVTEFHSLVPELASVHQEVNLPLLALQVTVFPEVGLCLGLAYHHVVADGRTFNNFIKTWASFCRESSFSMNTLPSYDRTVIIDRNGIEDILLNEWCKRKSSSIKIITGKEIAIDLSDLAQATFMVRSNQIEIIKTWITDQCKKKNEPQPADLSSYVITCSLAWVCLVKAKTLEYARNEKILGEDPIFFGFNAGGIARLDYRLPTAYFGNCIGFGRPATTMGELLSEDGIIVAAKAIRNTIKKLDKSLLGEADKWISDWEELLGSDLNVIASGSPKLDLYSTDFGWGRPKKIEEISIVKMNAISLTEARDFEDGIENQVLLPTHFSISRAKTWLRLPRT
ncbi:putative Anthocyanin 5-aromatic acyltransferase [Melia azedarach]|uniref:Anthocyanin 5-aromatic acyltransferase n=1 Tax=Melia azedarach TaxID=155640 RepID=A0ACC1XL48_MELAZ|nr:putative Anthocyanin 5-aromatic acyltransferase [Melia azedarach]